MAGETRITISGRLTADPEIRYTPSGAAVANLTVASNARKFDKRTNEWVDQDPLFLRCSVWREQAENVVESLTKGDAVVVIGDLVQRSYETNEGQKRTVVELQAEEVAVSLKWATAQPRRSDGGGQRRSQREPERQQQAFPEEPPF